MPFLRSLPHINQRVCRGAAFTFLVVLAGCSSQPHTPPPVESGSEPASNLTSWLVEGKLGFRSPAKNGSAFIRWQQNGSTYNIQLNGPFGAASTTIRGDSDFAILSQSGQPELAAENGGVLSEQLFGWQFPVTEMRFWVRGLAAPTAPVINSTEENGLLTSLEQSGWQLTLENYRNRGPWQLPEKIKGQMGPYSFVLVVKNWSTDTGKPSH